eukprot:TRINITY_DN11534_c0_g1_i1.p1 TRINITY_DN11534_c0_g1~~TRINITY_DN11534_c0_g1_i1.p1  ORF type:complete len:412 (-),score=84.21 TRINITY_DN11534_c0_g1_i1:197-1432(-)
MKIAIPFASAAFLLLIGGHLVAAKRTGDKSLDAGNFSAKGEGVAVKKRLDWQEDLEERLVVASGLVEDAIQKVQKGDSAAMSLARTWFGRSPSKDKDMRHELLRVMKSTLHVLSHFKAVKKRCDPDTFAYVFPEKHRRGSKFEMILCPLYFESKPQVQLETLIHEASHHKVGLLDDVCMDSIHGRGRKQRETKEFIVMSVRDVKRQSRSKDVAPDLRFDVDLTEGRNYWFVDPVTLEVLEDDDDDDDDEYERDYDDDYEDDRDHDEDDMEVPAVVHRIVNIYAGGRVHGNMALIQLDPAEDCDNTAYGRKDCLALAKTSPIKALRNADNFCYYVVDASKKSGARKRQRVKPDEQEASVDIEEKPSSAVGVRCECGMSWQDFRNAYSKAKVPQATVMTHSRAWASWKRICDC